MMNCRKLYQHRFEKYKHTYSLFLCFKSLKTEATQSYQGVTMGFCKTQPTQPHWSNSTAVKLLKICFQKTCIHGTALRFEVCLGSIYRLSLTSFLAVVSTELQKTLLASGELNAKLCLVNKAVCLDSFCRLGSLNFNASSGEERGSLPGKGRGRKLGGVCKLCCSQLFTCNWTDKSAFLTLCYPLFWPLCLVLYVRESF